MDINQSLWKNYLSEDQIAFLPEMLVGDVGLEDDEAYSLCHTLLTACLSADGHVLCQDLKTYFNDLTKAQEEVFEGTLKGTFYQFFGQRFYRLVQEDVYSIDQLFEKIKGSCHLIDYFLAPYFRDMQEYDFDYKLVKQVVYSQSDLLAQSLIEVFSADSVYYYLGYSLDDGEHECVKHFLDKKRIQEYLAAELDSETPAEVVIMLLENPDNPLYQDALYFITERIGGLLSETDIASVQGVKEWLTTDDVNDANDLLYCSHLRDVYATKDGFKAFEKVLSHPNIGHSIADLNFHLAFNLIRMASGFGMADIPEDPVNKKPYRTVLSEALTNNLHHSTGYIVECMSGDVEGLEDLNTVEQLKAQSEKFHLMYSHMEHFFQTGNVDDLGKLNQILSHKYAKWTKVESVHIAYNLVRAQSGHPLKDIATIRHGGMDYADFFLKCLESDSGDLSPQWKELMIDYYQSYVEPSQTRSKHRTRDKEFGL